MTRQEYILIATVLNKHFANIPLRYYLPLVKDFAKAIKEANSGFNERKFALVCYAGTNLADKERFIKHTMEE